MEPDNVFKFQTPESTVPIVFDEQEPRLRCTYLVPLGTRLPEVGPTNILPASRVPGGPVASSTMTNVPEWTLPYSATHARNRSVGSICDPCTSIYIGPTHARNCSILGFLLSMHFHVFCDPWSEIAESLMNPKSSIYICEPIRSLQPQ